MLLAPSTSDWLVELMSAIAPASASSSLSPALHTLAANARKLLIAFCSLSGEVLPRRPKAIPSNHGAAGADAAAAALAAQGVES